MSTGYLFTRIIYAVTACAPREGGRFLMSLPMFCNGVGTSFHIKSPANHFFNLVNGYVNIRQKGQLVWLVMLRIELSISIEGAYNGEETDAGVDKKVALYGRGQSKTQVLQRSFQLSSQPFRLFLLFFLSFFVLISISIIPLTTPATISPLRTRLY